MKKFVVVFALSLFLASIAYAETTVAPATPAVPAADEVAAPKKYMCPMDGFTSDKPGKCEKCGKEIEEKRLLAYPGAKLCMKCNK